MVKIEFLKGINLFELLTYGGEEYRNIFKKMLSEDFYIPQDKWYGVLIKIMCSNQCVGYIVGNYDLNDVLILEIGYLLPQYRDKGIFIEVLLKLDEKICLYMPNRFLINSLLVNGCAEVIGDEIIKSKFLLSFVDENDNLVYSYYYDLQRCGVVLGDFISPLQQVDVDCFKADVYR